MSEYAIPMREDPLVRAVGEALAEPCAVEPGDRLLIAISGGADSVALLRAVCALAERREWELSVRAAHVHHGLHEAADAHERFAAELAESLGLPFHAERIDPSRMEENTEAAARRMRYEALRRIAERVEADAVVTAHHADDQLETMLMRLVRGAAAEGLAGIAPHRRLDDRRALIRPMLRIDRTEIERFLTRHRQSWREDPTNADRRMQRNRLRAEVLPVLRELRPDAATKAAETADQLRHEAAYLESHIEAAEAEWVHRDPTGGARMDRSAAAKLEPPVLAGLIRRRCRAMGCPADGLGRRQVEPVARAIRDAGGEPRRFQLAGGVEVRVAADRVEWTRRA